LTHLKHSNNVLVSTHGNSLGSIIMALDNLSQEEVLNLEPATGIPILYDINEQGKVISKTTLD